MAPTLISGSQFTDERGSLNFFNTLDLKEVARFYEIAPNSTSIIRAWQGHQNEKNGFIAIQVPSSFILLS